ncbi:integral membrane protein 2B [Drosophila gunungcola]|uniref:integral membrane protein 2B n=1 Tax=Drosophila gunungcola TaxID=103775 RepID=UPI0022E43CBF|nr:integral membrane protein 2B [Drosophila gunungcola]
MTILGKLRGEITDQEKVPLPMNLNDEALMHHGSLIAPKVAYSDNEADAESMVFNRPQHHCLKSFLLFLIAVVVMLLGVLGGWTLYRVYAPSHGSMRYHALCEIPYPEDSMEMARVYPRSDGPFALNWRSLMPDFGPPMTNSGSLDDNYFREDIELDGDSDEEGYARVDVPDFKDGRRGRFMHDFKENQSAIIDTTTGRCFIMPLDRDTTLPPTSFADLMKKMSTGYYNIDTERVRRQMRVVTPRITDLSLFSERIANECYDMKVYMMEKFVSGISKRSADPLPDSGKYAEFMGKGVIEYDLANIAEVEAYEANEANQRA